MPEPPVALLFGLMSVRPLLLPLHSLARYEEILLGLGRMKGILIASCSSLKIATSCLKFGGAWPGRDRPANVLVQCLDFASTTYRNTPECAISYTMHVNTPTTRLSQLPHFSDPTPLIATLIRPLERWHSLTLLLIQRIHLHLPVPKLHLLVRLLLEGDGVLHPFLIVSLWIILTGVCSTRFLAVDGGFGSLNGAGEEVAELEGFDEVAVPDHAAVLGADLGEGGVDFFHSGVHVSEASYSVDETGYLPLHACLKRLLRSEHGYVLLHHSLHRLANLVRALRPVRVPDEVDAADRIRTGISRNLLVRLAG